MTDFPEKVTAFRPDMAVHGKFGKPCPVCGEPVQRIVYAHNEANYCARCQTGGRLLSDRALSRLLGPGLAANARRNGDPETRMSRFAGISRLHGHGEFRAFPAVDQVQRRRRPGLRAPTGRGRAPCSRRRAFTICGRRPWASKPPCCTISAGMSAGPGRTGGAGRAAGVALRLLRFHAANAADFTGRKPDADTRARPVRSAPIRSPPISFRFWPAGR